MATLTTVRSSTVMIVPRMTTAASTRISRLSRSLCTSARAGLVVVLVVLPSVIVASQEVGWLYPKYRVDINLEQLYLRIGAWGFAS